jgi:hypothetical protein
MKKTTIVLVICFSLLSSRVWACGTLGNWSERYLISKSPQCRIVALCGLHCIDKAYYRKPSPKDIKLISLVLDRSNWSGKEECLLRTIKRKLEKYDVKLQGLDSDQEKALMQALRNESISWDEDDYEGIKHICNRTESF